MPDSLLARAPELTTLGIGSAARLVERGKLSPVDLAQAFLDRAQAFNPQLDAYLMITAETALQQARVAEAEIAAGQYRGHLHGIPFALKDIFSTVNIRTTGHSRVCAYTVPTEDAAAVTKLYQAGGILLGKLATHEFAHGGPSVDLPWPPARNPWNTAHITGGSSSGSGAALAADLTPAALGTDTGGSIRLPAALCGIVGLKPTYGLVSRRGVYPNAFSFDHVGPMARTVADCALLLAAIAGHDPLDPASAAGAILDIATLERDLTGLRIGVARHWHETDIATDPEVVDAFETALAILAGLGAQIEDVRLRPAKQYSDVKITIAESELFSVHAEILRTRPGDFGEDMLGRALGAVLISGADYMQAQRERRVMLTEFAALWQRYDAIVSPTTPSPAPVFGAWRTAQFWQKASFTTPWNVAAGPALSQCMGFSTGGLPLALQIAGKPFDDVTVLQIAHAYETATDWRRQRPALTPGDRPPPLPPSPDPVSDLGDAARAGIADAVRRAGLTLTERQFELLCAAAPHVEAMTARLRRPRAYADEPANTFRCLS